MNMLLMMLLGTALCYAGMAGLSLAMPRNYSQLNAAKLSARNNFVLRVASIALLIVSLWPVISMWGDVGEFTGLLATISDSKGTGIVGCRIGKLCRFMAMLILM